MKLLAKLAALFVAIEHIGILALEMFFWDHEVGRKVFNMTPEQSAETAVLAANQGLYNGFLAVGLLWGIFAKKRDVIIFFLGCVIVAGLYGSATAKFSILYTQAVPAAIALGLTLLAKKN